MTWTQIILILGAIPLLVGYLFGSVNFGVVVSRLLYHEDIRTKGSGNAGTTNILRTYGKKAAALTLAGDMLKGVAAVVLCRWAGMLLTGGVEVNGIYAGYLAAIGAVCGHLWPVWFGFKGGKGVAVAAGTILAAAPRVFVALLVVFVVVVSISRIVSLTSITCAVCYPIFTAVDCVLAGSSHTVFNTVCALVMAAIVVWLHRTNIQRLKNGTEYKFGSKK